MSRGTVFRHTAFLGKCASRCSSQLRSADEFDAFCVEKFAGIHARFTAAMTASGAVSLLPGKRGRTGLAKPCAATLISSRR